MITEDYVSFETAKLLKEKGFGEKFDEFCPYSYSTFLANSHCFGQTDLRKGWMKHQIYAPTLQMTMKWLRETHDFNINTELNIHGYFCSLSHIVRDPSGSIIDIEDSEAWETAYYDSYEQAVEAAIKYCLENLI